MNSHSASPVVNRFPIQSSRGKDFEECFEGFAWPVLTAFASELNQCRFERGDTFYDSPKGYQEWEKAAKSVKHSLRVLSPAHATGATANKEGVFSTNWRSQIVFTVTNHKTNESHEVTSTQGRFYSLLLTGEWKVLDAKEEPQIPKTCQDRIFLTEAEKVAKAIDSRCCSHIEHPNLFVMPYDPTHPITAAKYQVVKDGLSENFTVVEEMFKPREVGLENVFAIPTLRYVAFLINSKESQSVARVLKKLLYTPSKDKKTDRVTFQFSTHGCFLPFSPVISNEENEGDNAVWSYPLPGRNIR